MERVAHVNAEARSTLACRAGVRRFLDKTRDSPTVVLRADRHARAGRWLEWKVRLFTVAALLGLAGLYLEDRRFTGAALALLFAAVLLRLLPGAEGEDHDGFEGDDDVDEGESEAAG